MEREIKFRGKNSAGYWINGGYFYEKELEEHRIITDSIEFSELCESIIVDPETVGQFTGLKDENGKEIYEGDFGSFDLAPKLNIVIKIKKGSVSYSSLFDMGYKFTKKGNIHDNPEILKKADTNASIENEN